jgi:hypothetical protein
LERHVAKAQLELVVADPNAEATAIDDERLLRAELFAALRAIALELTYEVCARELDKRWGELGRPVSASVLRASLHDVERNNFRAEWLLWFATKSDRVSDLLLEIAGGKNAVKPPEDELDDLKSELRREFPRQAEALIRKGKAPRRR